MSKKLISIIIPVYNSELTLEELTERITKTLTTTNYSFEIIFIDDGSRDKSWSILTHLNQNYPFITCVRFTKNFGQHAALLSGFTLSKGELVITLDDDLQHPPEELLKLIGKYEETQADVVYGIPINKQHSKVRNISSKVVTLTSEDGDHQGSSFRLIKKEIINNIVSNHQSHFIFIDSLLSWYTGNFSSVMVEHFPRKKGKSGYTMLKLFRIHFQTMINYSAIPLRMIMYGAFIVSVLSIGLGSYYIYKKIMFDVPLGYTSLIVAILFSSSLIILGLGFIGLYVHKLYQSNLRKPIYFVNKILSKRT